MLLNKKGFTVIEVLIVLYIISLLFGIFIYFWNTYGIFSKSRDSARLYSLNLIDSTLKTLLSTNPNAYLGEENIIYISLPDTTSTCGSYNLIKLNPPFSYRCSSSPKNINGNGWIPIDFTQNKFLNISFLPVDPLNNQDYFFAYQVRGKRYKLTAKLESKNMIFQMANDGGFEPTLYEIGTDLFIPSPHSGLVGYWSFDEGTGNTAYDYSGNNNHGTLFNEPQWVDGKIGKALSFDGRNDYIKSSSANGVGNKAFTECLWVKFNSFSTENQFGYIRSGGTNSARYFYFSSWCSAGAPRNCIHLGTLKTDGTWGRSIATGRIFEANRWYFICGTIDTLQGFIKAYIDGNLFHSASIPTGDVPGTPYEIWIGGSPEGYQWANGLIDEVRIYNRALSAEEIKALYEATK